VRMSNVMGSGSAAAWCMIKCFICLGSFENVAAVPCLEFQRRFAGGLRATAIGA
jgi:hypothetical protein